MAERLELLTFGCGFDGRLGLGDENHQTMPRPVTFFRHHHIQSVAVGGYHTLVHCDDALYAFGCNEHGQLGVGGTVNRKVPLAILGLDGKKVQGLGAGQHTSYVIADEVLWSFGAGGCGQLGHSTTGADCHDPRPVILPEDTKVLQLAVGSRHVVLWCSTGVYTFGAGEDGQLGHGDRIHRFRPTRLEFFDRKPVTRVAAGCSQSFVWVEDGAIYTFGTCFSLQKGVTHPVPLDLDIPPQAVRGLVAAPDFLLVWHTEGLSHFGTGRNDQFAKFHSGKESTMHSLDFFAQHDIQAVSATDHALILCDEGVYSFGDGYYGQLGYPDPEDCVPQLVGLPGPPIWVGCGSHHSCVLIRTIVLQEDPNVDGNLAPVCAKLEDVD